MKIIQLAKKYVQTHTTGLTLSICIYLIILHLTGCEKEITITEPNLPDKGSITINSEPANAKIYWEGYYTGYNTPYTMEFLDYKEHEFILKLNYYRDTIFSLAAVENDPREINIDYFQNPLMYGSIQCTSTPSNAAIFINDSSTGKTTPAIFNNLVPGPYEIKYSYPDHRDDSLIVTVKSSTIPKAQISLQDTSIWVDYQVNNSGILDQFLTCIAVDKNDVKWMGTSSYGALTFDGTEWQYFNTSNSPLPSNKVQEIGVDPETGKVWICTASGVGIYDGTGWEVYTPFNSILEFADFTSVAFIGGGKTWLGTNGEGLAMFDGSEWQIFLGVPGNKSLPTPSISDLFMDNDGLLWVGNLTGGFNRFDGTTWRRYFYHGSPPSFLGQPGKINSNFIKSIGRDAAGRVWIGHWGGSDPAALSMYDLAAFYNFGNIIVGQTINCIFVDDHDNKWVGTESALTRFKELSSAIVYYDSNSGLSSNYITQVAQDSKGVIWISTYGGGLVKYKGEL